MLKQCKICKEEKQLDDFQKSGRSKYGKQQYRTVCKECLAINKANVVKTESNMTISNDELLFILRNKKNRIKSIIYLNSENKKALINMSKKYQINLSDSINLILKKYFNQA